MKILWKTRARDDHGVVGILNFEGFSQTEIDEAVKEYNQECKETEKLSDLGNFVYWFRQKYCTSNSKDISITYS